MACAVCLVLHARTYVDAITPCRHCMVLSTSARLYTGIVLTTTKTSLARLDFSPCVTEVKVAGACVLQVGLARG